MKQKRGQFFLVAAVIIVSILAGIYINSNKILFQDSSSSIKLIKEEVKDEGRLVINQYLINEDDSIDNFVNEMTSNLLSRNPNLEIIFFFRNETSINVFNLARDDLILSVNDTKNETIGSKREKSEIKVVIFGTEIKFNFEELIQRGDIVSINVNHFEQNPKKIRFTLNETTYETDWIEENRFYFLIKQEREGATYVAETEG